MDELRDTIARAILMVTQGNVPVEYAWNAQFEEVQDELLAQADAAIEALGLREERVTPIGRPERRRYVTDWEEARNG